MNSRPLLVIITGPTASGKTSLAITLAKHYKTEIISADSRQFYREIPIGTAQPSKNELQEVKHHFIGNLSVTQTMTAGLFAKQADALLYELFQTKKVVILCGGTGLYIQALISGLDKIPAVSAQIREGLNRRLVTDGLSSLVNELRTLDPEFCLSADLQNPQRVIRALEVCLQSGQPYSSFRNTTIHPEKKYDIIEFCLQPERQLLYSQINKRVDYMLEIGLEEEAKSVQKFRNENALKTVGYNELFDYFDGKISKEEAISLIKQHTRNYAKRQMTWFKKMSNLRKMDQNSTDLIIAEIDKITKTD